MTPRTGNPTRPRVVGPRLWRVLLAGGGSEDRRVIETLLHQTGGKLRCASDAQEAVAAGADTELDAILMDADLSAPGPWWAARSIRASEGRTGATPVPIVALLAETSADVVADASAAGCDAYLVRPFAAQALIAELERLIRRTARLARIDAEIADLLPGYLERRRDDVRVLRAALAERDFATVQLLGHRMKGSGGSYGIPGLSAVGGRLERAGTCRDADASLRAIEEFEALLERLAQDLPPTSAGSTRSL